MKKDAKLSRSRVNWYGDIIRHIEKISDGITREIPMNGCSHNASMKLIEGTFWLKRSLENEKKDPLWAQKLYELKEKKSAGVKSPQ